MQTPQLWHIGPDQVKFTFLNESLELVFFSYSMYSIILLLDSGMHLYHIVDCWNLEYLKLENYVDRSIMHSFHREL